MTHIQCCLINSWTVTTGCSVLCCTGTQRGWCSDSTPEKRHLICRLALGRNTDQRLSAWQSFSRTLTRKWVITQVCLYGLFTGTETKAVWTQAQTRWLFVAHAGVWDSVLHVCVCVNSGILIPYETADVYTVMWNSTHKLVSWCHAWCVMPCLLHDACRLHMACYPRALDSWVCWYTHPLLALA